MIMLLRSPFDIAPPLTEQAEDIDRVWDIFFISALAVGGFVAVLVLFILLRFRRRDDQLPRQVRENIPFEIAYTVVPLLMVIVLVTITFVSVRAIDDVSASDDDVDLVVGVTGFQWQWQFEYPEAGVVVTGTETDVPELVLPASSSVRFDLASVDVIHSFWIPGFRFKRDVIPGRESSFQVDIGDETGTFDAGGVCAEFCGLDHHKMFFDVRVVTPAQFEQWTAERTGAQP